MGKQDSETPGVCVRAYTFECVCITEHKTGNAELASADSRGSTEISSVTPERHTHTYSHTENKFLMQRFGETPGLDKHRHADNSKMPPHEFCSRLSLLDIFMKKKKKRSLFGKHLFFKR